MCALATSQIFAVSTLLCCATVSRASDDVFDPNMSGFWGVGTNWQDNTTPGNNDTASFSLAGSPIVTFNAASAAIQALSVIQASGGGPIIMQSIGGPFTLNVTSATGTQNVTLTNRNLTLGNAGNPLHLTSGNTTTVNGAALSATNGSKVLTTNANIGISADGSVSVDGAGGEFRWTGSAIIGSNGNDGFLTFSNASGSTSVSSHDLQLANSNVAGTTGTLTVNSGAALRFDGQFLASSNSNSIGAATVNVQGASSIGQLQSSTSPITIGNQTGGTATVNIGTTQTGASFFTGASNFTIFNTGTVNVGSSSTGGSLNTTFGNLIVDGGHLNVSQNGTFLHNDVTVQNGGVVSVLGNYNITKPSGFQQTIITNATLFTTGRIDISNAPDTGEGWLNISGATASITAGSASTSSWGVSGNFCLINFSYDSIGSFNGGIDISPSGSGYTEVNVESGADLTVGNLSVASSTSPAEASVTVTDAGSTITLNPGRFLTVGAATGFGTGAVNIRDGGIVTVGPNASTIINATGTVNLDGGTLNTPFMSITGSFNFNGGTLGITGDNGLAIGSGQILGTSFSATPGRTLNVTNTTTINGGSTLTLDGGTFNTGALVKTGTLIFNSGTLGITGPGGLTVGSGGLLGSNVTLGAGKVVNVTGTTTVSSGSVLSVESAGQINTGFLSILGTLSLDGANSIVGNSGGSTMANSGLIRGTGQIAIPLNSFSTGEVRAESGHWLRFTSGNPNSNSGRISLMGGVVEFNQPLTNGGNGQILGNGTLITRGTGLNNIGQMVFSGDATSIYGDVNNNTSTATKGITVSGNTNVTFWDDVTHAAGSMFKVQVGSSVTFFGTFSGGGSVTGGGNVYMEADLTPGTSPASVTYTANVFLGTESTTRIELGGTAAGGQYDQISVIGNLSLGGALAVSTINGFAPTENMLFNIFDWTGAASGLFATISLPGLPGLAWDTSRLYTHGELRTTAAVELPGDFNHDGSVDGADYVVWRKGASVPTLPDYYDLWRRNFGRTQGIGGGATAVPEPEYIGMYSWLLVAAFVRSSLRTRWFREI